MTNFPSAFSLHHHICRCLGSVAIVSLLLVPAARANGASEFPPVIDLSSLDGNNGFQLDGAQAGEWSGVSVSDAGDINGDGYGDIMVAAPQHGTAGASYVVFGKAAGFPEIVELGSLNGTDGFRIDGAVDGSFFGYAGAAAGDVNKDGFDDLIIGAQAMDADGGKGNSGSNYVIFGKGTGFGASFNVSSLNGKNGFRLDGEDSGDFSGYAVASAGDVNGDGFADLAIGAIGASPHGAKSGKSYVVFGKAAGFAATTDLADLDGSNGFILNGEAADDLSGRSVSAAGDVNHDGFGDVLIGADQASPNGTFSGSGYVVFGKASGFARSIDLSSLNGNNGFRIPGLAAADYNGFSASGAGDVNGDGHPDIIIGAEGTDNVTDFGGSSYVLFGKTSGFPAAFDLASLDGTNGFRLDGFNYQELSGRSVSLAGDVNADGFADVIIGAWGGDRHGMDSGSSYVVFGKAAGFPAAADLSILDGTNGFRLDGETSDNISGYWVSTAGDVNGDGFADVVIGAYRADPHGQNSGSSYVVFGRAPVAAVTRDGSAASQYISGGAFGDHLNGLAGNDRLEGRGDLIPKGASRGAPGTGDVLNGGTGSDTASYAHAPAKVVANLGAAASNTGDAKGDTYVSIENLEGSAFADTLTGDGAANRLAGGKGADTLKGGAGKDVFAYSRIDESPAGTAHDKIADFNAGTATSVVDKIDLSAIDAKTGVNGNQAFSFIGTKAFSKKKGQLRLKSSSSGVIVQGDVTGDGKADLEIKLTGFTSLAKLKANDFKL
jgi:hypothetical protein